MSDRIVDFEKYCKLCKNVSLPEENDICDECLDNPVKNDSRIPVNFDRDESKKEDVPKVGYYDSINKIKPYLYEVTYSQFNRQKAEEYFKSQEDVSAGGCTAICKGNLFARNFDWNYSNQAEFLVRTPNYIGIGGGFSKLTDEFVDSGKESDLYYALPFQLQDGINEFGVCASINVVPSDYNFNKTKPNIYQKHELSALEIIAFILERFDNAKEAAHYIRDYVSVYFPKTLHKMNYEVHFLICDYSSSYVLEFVNNTAVVIPVLYSKYITNFFKYLLAPNRDGSVYTPETQDADHDAIRTNHITYHGSGLERYNLVNSLYSSIKNKKDMRDLMNDLKYTRSYITSPDVAEPYWYTEFVGGDLTVASQVEDFSEIIEKAGQAFSTRSREKADTWHTMHSSIYDMNEKKLYLVTQEDGEEMEFTL